MSGSIRPFVALATSALVLGFTLRADAQADSAAEWAGWYTHPSSSSVHIQLSIASDSSFYLRVSGCFGALGSARGRVQYRDGRLLLNARLPTEAEWSFESKTLIPVRLGERVYLVGVERAGKFFEATTTGTLDCKDDCPDYFVREGDPTTPPWTSKVGYLPKPGPLLY